MLFSSKKKQKHPGTRACMMFQGLGTLEMECNLRVFRVKDLPCFP